MNDDIKEIKIGMYTTDEILEFMTDGEGRSFMGRSMYDAIIDYITNLQNTIIDQEDTIQDKKECIFALETSVTNLQEQLHKASLDIQELTEKDLWCPTNCDKLKELQEENDYYFKMNNEISTLNTSLRSDRDIYKSRIDKALGFLNNCNYKDDQFVVYIIKLLQGSDKE